MPEGVRPTPQIRPGVLRWHTRLAAWLASLGGWRADLAASLVGGLAALALPPWHALPLLPIAFAGLLVLIDATPAGWRGMRRAARRGFWFGFGGHLIGLYWLTEAILTRVDTFWWLVPFATPLTAAGLSLLFTAVPAGLVRGFPQGLPRVLGFSGLFALSALAQGTVLTGFPWNLWGSVWALPGWLGDVFIQPASWVGIYGLTLATLLLAALPTLGRRGLAAATIFLLAWFGAGLSRLDRPLPPPHRLRVALLQGDIPVTLDWTRATALAVFRTYLVLTREAASAAGRGPIAIVWPEAASPFLLETDGAARAAIAEAAGPGVPVLAGSIRFDARGRPRNSLIVVDGPGPPVAIYDKWHLVPFGEYQPSWFPLPIQVVPGGGFAAGPGPRTLHVPGLPPFGPLICYEAIFSGEIVARPRPTWLINITDDAWFGNTAGPRQHLEAARMRAVEEGLPLLRAANTGISAAFDARGHEIARLGLGRQGVLTVPLPAALPPTLYARFGRLIPFLLVISTIVLAGLASLASETRKS
ncbi:MAG TPA: apolipoprotein N-acyltransferase [Acetobacteraceae bacterium]|nr:apolipoprotein N-acyltransferase [Acetobacteraceae bacterium]